MLSFITRMSRHLPRIFALLVVFLSFSLHASIIDRHPLAEPRTKLIDAVPGRVVASEGGMFLVHGQRITADGVNLDEGAPIAAATGFAVGWNDGWLVLRPSYQEGHSILHVSESGEVATFAEVSEAGDFVDAAATAGNLAILDRVPHSGSIWITVVNKEGLVSRELLAKLDSAVIRSFGDGFLVVSLVRSSFNTQTMHAWRLDSNGVPQELRKIGTVADSSGLSISINGNRALVVTSGSGTTLRIIDTSLEVTEPVVYPQPNELPSPFPLPLGEEQFIVSYGERAMVIDGSGGMIVDAPAAPIVAGDRAGDRFLVLRPWGDAGLASGDPRSIDRSLEMKQNLYLPPLEIYTVVSSDVTLVTLDFWEIYWFEQTGLSGFVRFDGSGLPIDPEPQPTSAEMIISTPDGFAFFFLEEDWVSMRRLTRRGGWLDEEPIRLIEAPDARAFAADAGEDDLLIAWANDEKLLWSRFSLDGSPLQSSPSHVERGEPRDIAIMGVTRHDGNRLLLLFDTDACYFSPCVVGYRTDSLVLDSSGEPLGPLHELPMNSPSVEAIGLDDGTWVVPLLERDAWWSNPNAIHLSGTGELLASSSHHLLEGMMDVEPAPGGWRAVAGSPIRIVEVLGFDQPTSMTGLGDVSDVRLGYGDWLAFLDDAPAFAPTSVPFNGRIEAVEGDLSIRLFDVGRDDHEQHLRIEITNEGSTVVRDISVVSQDFYATFGPFRRYSGKIAELQPGETTTLGAYVSSALPTQRFTVVANGLEDVDVSDNSAEIGSATPLSRRRTVGRGN